MHRLLQCIQSCLCHRCSHSAQFGLLGLEFLRFLLDRRFLCSLCFQRLLALLRYLCNPSCLYIQHFLYIQYFQDFPVVL